MSARRRRAARVLLAASVLLTGLAVLGPGGTAPAGGAEGSAVTRSVTATRTFLDEDGTRTEVSRHTVTLRVSATRNLRGRQEIGVSWQGAVPTQGVVTDPHSADAKEQEYALVLLQCRGVDTGGAVPRGQTRISPETCWTQTASERYFPGATATPAWRFDAAAPAAQRAATVGSPAALPDECRSAAPASARWLPFRAADGTVYAGGPNPADGCVAQPPESSDVEGGGLPSNATYAATGTDGTGKADFSVWTANENASLGCSARVACALVAVPIVGLSCDAWGHELPSGTVQTTNAGTPLSSSQLSAGDTACRRTGRYQPGEGKSVTATDQAVRGSLWWSASNWRHRITVPLDFAVAGDVCDVESATKPLEIIGSVVANELTAAWRPTFCTDRSLFGFNHIQQADGLARRALASGELSAALTSTPVGDSISRPVVQVPVTVGGFAIAFAIDGVDKERVEDLRLNARLVAKLLTSSYPAVAVVRNNREGLADNPYNISVDPEFQALNPGLPGDLGKQSAAALQSLSSSADLVWALTSWIDADREARAWLDGTPDPWGMKVNPAYRGLDLPVDNWPLLDDFVAPDWFKASNPCYRNSPTPFSQLVANPQASLGTVVLNLQYGRSSVRTVCAYDGQDATTLPFRLEGAQAVGSRFVLGLVTLSAAERYHLRTAALQTTSSVPAGERFGDAGGRTFVAGDPAGLRAGAALLRPADRDRTWALDYSALNTAGGARAYPGTLPVYATVPTSDLASTARADLVRFACYAHGPGQVSGQGNGQLPPGYLPLTAANGLGAAHDYQLTAARAVAAQAGAVPTIDTRAPREAEVCRRPAAQPPSQDAAPTKHAGAAPGGGTVPGAAAPAALPAPGAASPPAAGVAPPGAGVTEAPVALTAGQSSGFGRLGVPGLLLLAVASGLAGVLVRWYEQVLAGLAAAGPTARTLMRRARSARHARGARRKERP